MASEEAAAAASCALPAWCDVARLDGVTCSRLVSRRRNGSCVTLQLYRREAAGHGHDGGPLILWVAGMCGNVENFIYQLRGDTRRPFVAYDLAGCGRSGELAGANVSATFLDCVEHMYAPPQLCDDLEAVWRHATRDGERASLIVAHSYSTSLTTQWLASLAAPPPRLCGVVLLETHASLPPLAASRAATFARSLPLALRYAAVEFVQGPARWWRLLTGGESGSAGTLGTRGSRSATSRKLWLAWERQKSAALYAASVCTFAWARPCDFSRAYATTPLAVAWGTQDKMTPPDARMTRALAPALVALRLFEGYAHWPFLDNPAFDAWLHSVMHAMTTAASAAPTGSAHGPASTSRAFAALRIDTPPTSVDSLTLTSFIGNEEDGRAPELGPECVLCGGECALACAWCAERYCSVECQRVAWERGHGEACARLRP